MVELLRSEWERQWVRLNKKKVKLEVQDDDDDDSVSVSVSVQHQHKHKRPMLDIDASFSALYKHNPLNGPSPLGLRLRKSPSLLDLIQITLSHSQQLHNPKPSNTIGNSKIKASNFPATILKIGTWEYKSRYEGDLVAKCYFAKHKLVWEVLDGCLKNKIEFSWSDIWHLKASCLEDGPGALQLVLARRPLFFREVNPQPRKHALWQATSDFTGGQASLHRQHFLQCTHGLLGKHFEKLIQCDPRLNFLSQQSHFVLHCPYFEPAAAIGDQMESSDSFDRKSQEQAGFFGSQNVESGSAVQSNHPKSEHNLVGKDVGKVSGEINSPGSVMDTYGIKDFRSRRVRKFPSNLDQMKLHELQPSMSMIDLVSHIEHCISEQMASSNPNFTGEIQHSKSILEEFTQCLFNDSQLTSAINEQFVMSRVNSLCCHLQKGPSTAEDTMIRNGNGLDVDDGGNVPAQVSSCKSMAINLEGQQDDASGCCKRGTGISRKESVGDLLLNLPRIASLPQFLFHMSDDYVNQVR